jgi:hypothetical protein
MRVLLAAFYFASVIAGVPLGMLLKSDLEGKLLPNRGPWLLFGSSSWLRLLSSLVVKIFLIAILFFAPFVLLSEVARHSHVFLGRGSYLLYLIGILLGKALRFMYWYCKREWD